MQRVALALDLVQQVSPVFQKEGMFENLDVHVLDLNFVEVVHVQLANERRKVVVFEELRQDGVAELVLINDFEPITFLCPANHFVRGFTFDNFEELHKEGWYVMQSLPLLRIERGSFIHEILFCFHCSTRRVRYTI